MANKFFDFLNVDFLKSPAPDRTIVMEAKSEGGGVPGGGVLGGGLRGGGVIKPGTAFVKEFGADGKVTSRDYRYINPDKKTQSEMDQGARKDLAAIAGLNSAVGETECRSPHSSSRENQSTIVLGAGPDHKNAVEAIAKEQGLPIASHLTRQAKIIGENIL